MATYTVEILAVNADGQTIYSKTKNVDGEGFVALVDRMTAKYGKLNGSYTSATDATLWFPIHTPAEDTGAAPAQPALRIVGQTVEFMRQVYADFRKESCNRCGGSGIYGATYNAITGRPQGGIGQCFRCKGHGKVTGFVNALGDMGMALWGSGFQMPSYDEFCREYRQYQPRVAPRAVAVPVVAVCEDCRNAYVTPPARFCADCSEAAVAEFEDAAAVDLPDFVLDDGTYTMVYDDDYFTFRVRLVKTGKLAGKRVVEYLSGPDNTLDFQPFAFVNANTINVWRRFEGGNLVNRAREIEAMARNDREGMEAAGLLYAQRSSRCRRCNKVLTVDASLNAGYGPDCAAQLGIAYGASRRNAGASSREDSDSYSRVMARLNEASRQAVATVNANRSPVVDSILTPDYLSDLSNDELDERIDSVTRAASRGDHYDAITNALEGERQRRIENGLYPNVRIEDGAIIADPPVTLIEAWQAMSADDRKIALQEINAGFQEAMNETNGTTRLVY